ncbi:hypothetical protein CF327_g7213 [Tilletia walkeri]|nr:hypothetical protein CF327_g7213 [Tilletia walkeri]
MNRTLLLGAIRVALEGAELPALPRANVRCEVFRRIECEKSDEHYTWQHLKTLDEPSDKNEPIKDDEQGTKRNRLDDDAPSLDELRSCQLTRDDISKMHGLPGWLQHLCGNFVRVQWEAEKDERGEVRYPIRIHEIVDVKTESSPFYNIEPGKPSSLSLALEMGPTPRWVRADVISSKAFAQDEYLRWIRRMYSNGEKLPSPDDLHAQGLMMDAFIEELVSAQLFVTRVVKISITQTLHRQPPCSARAVVSQLFSRARGP